MKLIDTEGPLADEHSEKCLHIETDEHPDIYDVYEIIYECQSQKPSSTTNFVVKIGDEPAQVISLHDLENVLKTRATSARNEAA